MQVPLTTVCQDVEQFGQLAASLILQALPPHLPPHLPPSITRHDVQVRVIQRDSITKVFHL